MTVLGLFRDEWVKLLARKRTYIGFGAFLGVQLAILGLLQHPRAQGQIGELLGDNGLGFENHYMGLTMAVVVIAFTYTLLGALYVALIAGEVIAKEVEDGTMRMLLSRPVSRMKLLIGKSLAVTAYSVGLVLFLGVTALAFGTAYRGGLGDLFIFIPEEQLFARYDTGEGVLRYARAVACLALGTVSITGLAVMFSCFDMKPAAATILTLSLFFVDLVLANLPYFQAIQHYFVTYHFRFWARTFHDPVPWPAIAGSVAYLLGWTATFFTIGAARFCTRDFKA
ncbi:MAG: ABC transporter permease subunit [Planctomycetota bacterium]